MAAINVVGTLRGGEFHPDKRRLRVELYGFNLDGRVLEVPAFLRQEVGATIDEGGFILGVTLDRAVWGRRAFRGTAKLVARIVRLVARTGEPTVGRSFISSSRAPRSGCRPVGRPFRTFAFMANLL